MLNSQKKTFSIETLVLRTTRYFQWFLISWGEKQPHIWTTGTRENRPQTHLGTTNTNRDLEELYLLRMISLVVTSSKSWLA